MIHLSCSYRHIVRLAFIINFMLTLFENGHCSGYEPLCVRKWWNITHITLILQSYHTHITLILHIYHRYITLIWSLNSAMTDSQFFITVFLHFFIVLHSMHMLCQIYKIIFRPYWIEYFMLLNQSFQRSKIIKKNPPSSYIYFWWTSIQGNGLKAFEFHQ